MSDKPPMVRRPMIRIGNAEAIPLESGARYRSSSSAAPVDICFVFDTTGSMSNKIDGLVASTVDLVTDLATLRLDWRVTTVPFGDLTIPGDLVVTDQPWVNSQEDAEYQLRTMPRFSGGGNLGESSIEALNAALARDYRADAIRVVVLITDEPALESGQYTAEFMRDQLRQAGVICFTAAPDRSYFREWADQCGGTWTLISTSMDTASLRQLLRGLVRQVAAVANNVNQLAGGSVQRFLALPSRPDPRAIGPGGE